MRVRLRRVGEGLERRSGNLVALHEGLGERLGAFQLRRGARRAEDPQTALAEQVHGTGGQRRLRADDGERDLLALREVGQLVQVGDEDVAQSLVGRRAAVARRHVDHLDPLGFGELPGDRVFAPAVADDEDFHSSTAL